MPATLSADSRAALARLYRDHGYVVVLRGRRLLGSDAEAQELLHDVFDTLVQRAAAGESTPMDEPAAWLYAVATRRALTRIRDSSRRAHLLAAQLAPMLDGSPAASTGRAAELADLLAQLPADELRAIVHFHVDEFTHDEIAAQLGCSRRHVGNLLGRGRQALHALAGAIEEETHDAC